MATTYSTDADLNFDQDRLVQLTDKKSAPGVVNQALVDHIRQDAFEFVNGRLKARYVVPVTAPDSALAECRRLERVVRRYMHYEHRENMDMPKTILRAYELVLADLREYGRDNGELSLEGAARVQSSTPPTSSGGMIEENRRKFGREKDRLG